MKGITFLGKNVILVPVEDESKKENISKGGIYLLEEKPLRKFSKGRVVGVGDKCELVHKGDIVLYSPSSVFKIDLEGDEYILIEEDSIFALLKIYY